MRCNANTKKGKQCRNNAINNSNFCHSHVQLRHTLPVDTWPIVSSYGTYEDTHSTKLINKDIRTKIIEYEHYKLPFKIQRLTMNLIKNKNINTINLILRIICSWYIIDDIYDKTYEPEVANLRPDNTTSEPYILTYIQKIIGKKILPDFGVIYEERENRGVYFNKLYLIKQSQVIKIIINCISIVKLKWYITFICRIINNIKYNSTLLKYIKAKKMNASILKLFKLEYKYNYVMYYIYIQ